MKYFPLLGKPLKSDELLDLFETHDVEVVYEYDRTHENLPDEYWGKCKDLGVQFVFDELQFLKFIYIHLTDADGFDPADLSASDIEVFASKLDARSHAQKKGVPVVEGRATFLGAERDWIRLEFSKHSIHYEFRAGILALVTVTKK